MQRAEIEAKIAAEQARRFDAHHQQKRRRRVDGRRQRQALRDPQAGDQVQPGDQRRIAGGHGQ